MTISRPRPYGSVAVSLAGVTLALLTGCTPDRPPAPAAPPVVTPAVPTPEPASPPARTLTPVNLLIPADVPVPDPAIAVESVPEGTGRPGGRSSVCVPESLEPLGANAVRSANFRFVVADPDADADPPPDEPSVYTQALQFADGPAAQRAEQTYRGWVADCRDTLATSRDWKPLKKTQQSGPWVPVALSGPGSGSWTQVPLYRAAQDDSDNGVFETVGVTRVEDRLMITVDLVYGMDKITSDQPGGDPDSGVPADRQFALIEAAASRLTA